MLARMHLDGRLQRKLDPSDIVQQTLLEAHKDAGGIRGESGQEQRAWLRRVLFTNILNALRDFKRAKRDVARERSLDRILDDSSTRLTAYLQAKDGDPEGRLAEVERLERATVALLKLPTDQREAVYMRYREGLPLVEIGRRLQRSTDAAAALVKRGLHRIRTHLPEGAWL